MVKVKIGEKEYQLDSLSSKDLKACEAKKAEDKMADYDYTHYLILYAIKKFNPDVKLSLDEFMEMFPIKGIKEKLKEIGEIIGLDFKVGVGKLEAGKIT